VNPRAVDQAYDAIARHRATLAPVARLVLLLLAHAADAGGDAVVDLVDLAHLTGLSPSSTARALDVLVAHDLAEPDDHGYRFAGWPS
jgi:DNA-binding IclR family transcriptional regulator